MLIVIPTFNERDNLPLLIGKLSCVCPSADILVVDDNSPDGTGKLADEMAECNGRIHVLHRKAKEGIGPAYVAGFNWGLSRDYDRIVQMDADMSHDPNHLPALLAASEGSGLVIGSRYVPGGGIRGWRVHRRILSRGGNIYAGTILGIGIRDITSGFKCWRRKALEDIDLDAIRSTGYSFQVEMTYRAVLFGCSVVEVPIVFVDRTIGVSKMNLGIAVEAAMRVWQLRACADRLGRTEIDMKGCHTDTDEKEDISYKDT